MTRPEPIDTPTPDRPVELDPAMVEKARQGVFETTNYVPGVASDEANVERIARRALTAAGVPALVAEVERLHDALQASNGEAGSLWDQRDAALARATSAEQERDLHRRALQAVADIVSQGVAVDWEPCDTCDGTGTLGHDTCPGGCDRGAKRLDPALAGSGEQPGGTRLLPGWNMPHGRLPLDRPAPVESMTPEEAADALTREFGE